MTRRTVRQVQGEEMMEAMYPLTSYSLHASPPLADKDAWKDVVRQRQGVTCFAAFEDDAPVAVAASTAMTQNVRGALYGMGGIWGVATHPASRRRGHCRELMARLLGEMHASGQPFSGLYPFRESFYPRCLGVQYLESLLPLYHNLRRSVQRVDGDLGVDHPSDVWYNECAM